MILEQIAEVMEGISFLQPVLAIIGLAFILWGLCELVTPKRRCNLGGALLNIVCGVAVATFTLWVPSWFGFMERFLMGQGGEEGQSSSETPIETPAPAVPADMSWVPGVLTSLGVLSAVALTGLGLFHYYRKSLGPSLAKSRAEASTAAALVAEARKTLEWVVLDSASYETDLGKQIDYPMMTDVTVPVVSKYIRQMRYAQELERALVKKPLFADAERFSNAVSDLKVSYDGAVRKAERVRWSSFTFAEQKRLKDARIALDVVQDSSTTPEQRNAQYRRIAKLLDGLIVLTAPVKQSLSAWVPMLALEKSRVSVERKSPISV